MSSTSTCTKLNQVMDIPVHTKGPVPPPVCITDELRGDSMVLSSPTGPLQSCFLARHKIKPGHTRGRYYVDPKLKNGIKYIFLVEGKARLLLSTQVVDKKVTSSRLLDIKAPAVYGIAPGEACVLIPVTDGEFVEIVMEPHQTLNEHTVVVDFGEHLTQALSDLGFKG